VPDRRDLPSAARAYALLLRAYPRPYRRRFEGDMQRAFAAEHADARARGAWTTALFWIRTVLDAVRFGLAERRSPRSPIESPRRRWNPGSELRWACRALAARSRQAAFGVALLAITLGANGIVFSVADSLAFMPIDYPDRHQLVILQGHDPQSGRTITGLPADLVDPVRAQTDLVAAVHATTGGSILLTRGGEPVSVRAANVTPGLFEMLGARPIAGRTFAAADAGADAATVVVVREDLAREHFGDPAAAAGRTLETMTGPLHVLGVMPSTFRYQSGNDRVWRPLDLTRRPAGRVPSLFVLARTAPGVELDALQRALAERSPAIAPQTAAARGWPYTIAPAPFGDRVGAAPSRVYWFLLAAAVCLLLTACASIASVELSSAVARARTFAVASALGASRGSLMRIVLWEAGLLAISAVTLGAALAAPGTMAVAAALPDAITVRSTNAIDLDARALAFMAAAGALTWIVAALPVLHFATRQSTGDVLKLESRTAAGSRGAAGARRALAAFQVAVAVCLLIGATLGLRSYLALVSLDKGFDSTNLIGVKVTIPPSMPRTAAAIEATSAGVLARLQSLPVVAGATHAIDVPPLVWGDRYAGPIEMDGQDPSGMAITIRTSVTPDYFGVLRLPLRAGRTFAPGEPATSVIVPETFAQQFWPGTSAIGRRFKQQSDAGWLDIVGVTARMRNELDTRGAPSRVEHQIFLPRRPLTAAQAMTASGSPFAYYTVAFAVRLTDLSATAGVLDAVRAVDSRLLARAEVVDDLYAALFTDTRVATSVVTAFGVLAFAVALAGIYGVMAFLVAGRGREIAIRMALGADGRDVRRHVLRAALGFVLAGAAAGLLGAWAASRFVASQLYGVSPTDAATYAGVALIVVSAAILATWQPARRASRVDPAVALRAE
jgi:predicted permease